MGSIGMFEMLGIVVGGGLLVIGLSVIVFELFKRLGDYSLQKKRQLNSYKHKRAIKKNESKERNKAPEKLKILLQPDNKLHFENFVMLLNEIRFPAYPQTSVNEKGTKIPPSVEEIEDYEDEFDEALDEEDKMYDLYIYYLKSRKIELTESQLSYVVDLYKKLFTRNDSESKSNEVDISKIINNAFPKKFNSWNPYSGKRNKVKPSKILKKRIYPSRN